MAIAKASRVRGRLDGIVYKQYAGKVVLTKDPDMSNIKPSKEQKGQRNLFTEAVAYAKIINNDPELTAQYLKKIKKRRDTVFKFAMREFFEHQRRANKAVTDILNIPNPERKPIYDAYKRISKEIIEAKSSKKEALDAINVLEKEILSGFKAIRKELIKNKKYISRR